MGSGNKDWHPSEHMDSSQGMRTAIPPGLYHEQRRGLVLWIANKANRFQLKNLTIHYATDYLDRCAINQPLAPPALVLS
jgi:hypothetical protein